jgi:hypothetical protein
MRRLDGRSVYAAGWLPPRYEPPLNTGVLGQFAPSPAFWMYSTQTQFAEQYMGILMARGRLSIGIFARRGVCRPLVRLLCGCAPAELLPPRVSVWTHGETFHRRARPSTYFLRYIFLHLRIDDLLFENTIKCPFFLLRLWYVSGKG